MAKDITPRELKRRKPDEWDRWAPKMDTALLLVQSAKDNGFDIICVFTFRKRLYVENEEHPPDPAKWKWFTILTYRKAK